MAKKKKAKANRPTAVHPATKDEMLKWDAESQVKQAFMETPIAKRAVKETVRDLKKARAKVKRRVESKK